MDDLKASSTIFVEILNLDSTQPSLFAAITKEIKTQLGIIKQSKSLDLVSSLREIVEEYGPILIVLDEIGLLSLQKSFEHWSLLQLQPSAKEDEDVDLQSLKLKAAMSTLALAIQMTQQVPGVRVFCTGRSSSLAIQALSGKSSPLRPRAVHLHPLTANDIEEMFVQTEVRTKNQMIDDCALPITRITSDRSVQR